MLKPIVIPLAAIASIVAGVPAIAKDASSQAVSLAGLDPANPQDAREINRRVAVATETVCGSYFNTQPEEQSAIAHCRADVARQVNTQIALLRSGNRLAAR